MHSSKFFLALLSALCLLASRADAQAAEMIGLGGLDQMFSRIEAINIYYGGSIGRASNSTDGRRLPWAKDYGLEFLVHLSEFGRFTPAHERRVAEQRASQRSAMDSLRRMRTQRLGTSRTLSRAARDSIQARFAADSARINRDPEGPFKTTSITVKKHFSVVNGDTVLAAVDSEFVGTREVPPDERVIDLDLGIGYGQMDGIRNTGPFELHGSVRELPSVSAYATMRLSDRFGVYAGMRTGVITLQDAQLFVENGEGTSMFTLTSTSFEFGVPLGIDVQPVEGVHLTLEAAYMRRTFNSITFDPSSGFPSDYPRTLDLSGLSWSAGIQFPLP